MSLTCLLLITFLIPFVTSQLINIRNLQSTAYHNAYQFQNRSLYFNGTLSNTEHITFYGYKSVYGPLSTIKSSLANFLSFGGESSCSNISSIAMVDTEALDCGGARSCASIEAINISRSVFDEFTELSADGHLSLEHSKAHLVSADISCEGHMSCSNSEINTEQSVYATGAYCLMNSTIESIGNISVYLRGYYAAYGAMIHCNDGHECIMNCESTTGCSGMYLACDGLCKINVAASNAMVPITNISHSYPNTPILGLIVDNMTCFTESVTFDNYSDYWIDEHIVRNTFVGPICCRAGFSCHNHDIVYSTNNSDSAVLSCGGASSCKFAGVNLWGGNMHCSGAASCREAVITNVTNIHCFGALSCSQSNIRSGPTPLDYIHRSGYYPNPTGSINVTCSGKGSCGTETIFNIERGYLFSLYLLAQDAGNRANVNCESGSICNIYCHAPGTCDRIQLGGDGVFIVECDELSLCPTGWTSKPTPSPTNKPSQPTVSPTDVPTGLTFSPTFYPTSDPTTGNQFDDEPTNTIKDIESIDTTQFSKASEEDSSAAIAVLIFGSFLLLCIFVMFLFYMRNNHLKRINENQSLTKEAAMLDEGIIPGVIDQDKVIPDEDVENDEQMYDAENNTITPGTTKKGDDELMYENNADTITPGSGATANNDMYETHGHKVTVQGGDDL